MSYKYSFADNAEYGASDVNGLVSRLVSSGVADVFADGVAYNASALNGIVQAVYTAGVVPDNVDTLKVTKQSDGVIAIAPGLAFFADGSTITVTAAEALSYEAGVKNYVYVKQDLAAQNRNYPACTTTAPAGDYVLLAEIAADGTVTDKRTYAKGKVPGYQSNANVCMVSEQSIYVNYDVSGRTGTKNFSIDMGTNNYSRVFCICEGNGTGFDGSGQLGTYSLVDGSYFCVCKYGGYDQISKSDIIVGTGGSRPFAHITFSKNGNVLNWALRWEANPYNHDSARYNFTLVLC